MTMRKLADPILNDLMLMVQARKASNLSGAAITRYVQHLDRIDRELEAARVATGSIPAQVMDELVTVPRRVLEEQRAELRRLDLVNREGVRVATANHDLQKDLDRLGDYLLSERSADLAEGGAIDNAIRLLKAQTTPEETDETDDEADAGEPAQDQTRRPAPNRRSGSANRRA
jgi:hypothetical protein